jgi:hypothetical protein
MEMLERKNIHLVSRSSSFENLALFCDNVEKKYFLHGQATDKNAICMLDN